MKLLELFDTHLPTLNAKQLVEAAKVGREYQHLEDLLITDGAKGGIEAVNELKHIAQQPDTMNMKWDGGAAVYWGRNAKGEFVFAPKNQWDKGQMLDRTGLETEVQHTGRPRPGQSPEEFAEIRKGMAQRYMQLWDIFEKATPKDFRGYLNGDLMFTEQQQPGENGYYEFTPNKVTYRVAPNGLYGKMKTAKAFVAVHGKLQEFGAEATGNIEQVPEAEVLRFNKTPELIVLPTQHPAVKLTPIEQEAATAYGLIANNATAIDTIANYTADRFTGFKKILYDYAVKRAKAGGNLDFAAWLKDSKLSEPQKVMTQKVITEKTREWKLFWTAFDAILKLKHDVLEDLHNVHGKHMANSLGITAITNNKPGGEGFVKTMKTGGMAKLVNPEFRSAPDNPRFNPNISENAFHSWTPFELTKGLSVVDRSYIDPIAEALERKQGMEIITQKLAKLGSVVYHRDLTMPDISERLEKYKSLILKDMFYDIKENGVGYEVMRAVQALRAMGVRWPELAAVEKSIKSTNIGMYEDEASAINIANFARPEMEVVPKFIYLLNRMLGVPPSSIYDLGRWLDRVSSQVKDKDERKKIFASPEIQSYILNWATKKFNVKYPRNIYIVSRAFERIKSLAPDSQWPDAPLAIRVKLLTPVIDLLKMIHNQTYKANDLLETLNILKYFGVSFDSTGLEKPTARNKNKLLTSFNNISTVPELYSAILNARTNGLTDQYPVLVATADKFRKEIVHDLLIAVKSAVADVLPALAIRVINDRIAALRHIGIDWPELDSIEKSINTKGAVIKENITPTNTSDKVVYRVLNKVNTAKTASDLLFALSFVADDNIDPNKIKSILPVIEKSKSDIIQDLLNELKDSGVGMHGYTEYWVIRCINDLRLVGIKWPELNVIEKSVLHDLETTTLREELSGPEIEDDIYDNVQSVVDSLQDNDYSDGRYSLLWDCLSHLGEYYEDIPEVKFPNIGILLGEHKAGILKKLLTTTMKHGMDGNLVKHRILALRKLGAKWPELTVIEKSIQHDIEHSTKSLDESNVTVFNDRIHNDINKMKKFINSNKSDQRFAIRNVLVTLLMLLVNYQIKYDDSIELQEFLESNKHTIVKFLLDCIIHPIIEPFTVRNICRELKMFGVDWAELDVIQKSTTHDINNKPSLAEDNREKITCMACDGTGVEYDETCLTCGGKGETWDDGSYVNDDIDDSDYHNYIWNDSEEIAEEDNTEANTPKEVVWAFRRTSLRKSCN